MKTKEEIEQLAENYYISDYSTEEEQSAAESGFIDGYTQCQEDIDKRYTEEDIKEAIDMARMVSHVSCLEEGEHRLKYSNTEEDIINSLNKPDNEHI